MAVYDVNGNDVSTPVETDSTALRRSGYIKSVNHRGYNSVAPENTLPAFRLSKTNGFDYIETDIYYSKDNVPILLHDYYIDRTARNPDGTAVPTNTDPRNLTFEQLQEYDFGIWKSADYAGTKIPSLEQAIALFKAIKLHPYLEVSKGLTITQAQLCYGIVKDYGMQRNVTWASKTITHLQNILTVDPYARVSYFVDALTSEKIAEAVGLMSNSNAEVVIGTGLSDTDALIASAIAAGIELECGLIGTQAQALALNHAMTGTMSDVINVAQVIYNANIS